MKWFGFLPFTLEDSTHALRMRPADAMLLAGWQLYIASMYFSGWIGTVQELPMSKIMIYFSLLMYVVVSALTSVIQLRLACSRDKIERLLRMVQFSDELLDQLSHGINHSRQHLCLVALIVASILSSVGFVLVEWTVSWMTLDQTPVWKEFFQLSAALFYYAIRFASLCPLAVFIGGLLALRTRFRKLNAAFRFHFDRQGELDDADEAVQERLRTIAVCHDGLTEVVEFFCDIFSLQIISVCGSYTIVCIFAMYTSVALVTQDTSGTTLVTFFYVTGCLHYSSHILPIMKLGSDVRKEGAQLAVLVHRAINQSSRPACQINQLRLLSRQLLHHSPRVSCGMFSFDWTLCFSIFSGTATYTMIMTQFELAVPRFFMGALVPYQPNATNLLAPVT